MSGAVDIFGHVIGGRFLHAAATAKVGCLVFVRVPTGPVGHARVAGAPTGARLSSAECVMSAAIDIVGHVICGRFLYADTMAEVGCHVLARGPTGPVGHVHAAGAPTGARLSIAECQMSAAIDIFGHDIGGRFLYPAVTAEVGCLVFALVPTGPVGHARAASAPTGAGCLVLRRAPAWRLASRCEVARRPPGSGAAGCCVAGVSHPTPALVASRGGGGGGGGGADKADSTTVAASFRGVAEPPRWGVGRGSCIRFTEESASLEQKMARLPASEGN